MTISSNFDCIPAETGAQSAEMLHTVYVAIVSSLDKYFAKMETAETRA